MRRTLLSVEVVPHDDQRYETVGDWIVGDDGSIRIVVSDTGNVLDAWLVAIHELVEALLCQQRGVDQAAVDAFDAEFNRTHDLSYAEPGEDPLAPYFAEHAMAEVVERMVAVSLGVVWKSYEARLSALFGGK